MHGGVQTGMDTMGCLRSSQIPHRRAVVVEAVDLCGGTLASFGVS
jgi:hypothetical protein